MVTPSRASLEHGVGDMRLKSEEQDQDGIGAAVRRFKQEETAKDSKALQGIKSLSRSPSKTWDSTQPVGGDPRIKQEPDKDVKVSRSGAQRVEKRAPALFFDHEDVTDVAKATFEVLTACTYANKSLGATDPALECDCAEEWDSSTHSNDACGEDSDCINRATKMECAPDCGCGNPCQNQRFTNKQWADVTVIQTEKKGFGLRANTDLSADAFIFEYVGEVIGEVAFRKRMQNYDEQGIKHFYFMSLNKGEFVDATKRGNLGRFCNHSCNPNCYVDKWVVGDKLRMGIFAERKIKAGEELVFNYNVDRYGADPQPCYCGEPNCTGYIGGKTQTERSTKLSKATIEALGIDDMDDWNTTVAKKPRKKKGTDDDEEYVNSLQPKELEVDAVPRVMAQLPQCKEKWIAVKLLNRVQEASDPAVMHQVVRMHGYRHLKTALGNFTEDVNICLQILDVLNKLPRITRNKIQDSKIEEAVEPLLAADDERVVTQAKELLAIWSQLEVGYRIPRMKRDPNAATPVFKTERVDRRDNERRKSRSRSPEKVKAPSGPRNHVKPRPPPRFRAPQGPLPSGWFEATAPDGSTYYYNQSGTTSWQRPTAPSGPAPAAVPSKAISDQKALQDLISNIVAAKQEPAKVETAVATPVEPTEQEKKEAKWKTYPEDKQRKLYEGLIQPHVMHVVNKFKHKMEKDDLKRLAKDLCKKVVNSDFKNEQVKSLTVSDRHVKKIKKHVHETLLKAMRKKAEADSKKQAAATAKDEPALSEDEDEPEKADPIATKRAGSDLDEGEAKRSRTEEPLPPPPPPPPPPPVDGSPMDVDSQVGESTAPSPGVDLLKGELTQTATPPTTGTPDMAEAGQTAL